MRGMDFNGLEPRGHGTARGRRKLTHNHANLVHT